MFRIEREVEEVIACLRTPTPEIVAALQGEVLPHSQFRLSSLSLDELRNEQIIDRYVNDALRTAKYLVDRINAKEEPALTNQPTSAPEQICPECSGTGAFDLWNGESCKFCGGPGTIST